MEAIEGHNWKILVGDCREGLRSLPDASVQCCVTSPPYFQLRDYGYDGQIGLEETPEAYVAALVEVFREVKRVLRYDGTLWVNIGDSYSGSGPSGASYQSKTTKAREGKSSDGSFRISKTLESRGLTYAEKKPVPFPGLKPKDLCGVPWMLAFALRADGWYLRSDVIWHKPNPMPESVTDRPTKAHEYLFLLSKSREYFYDAEAVKIPLAVESIGRAERKQRTIDEHGVGTLGKQIADGVDPSNGYAGLALARNGKTGYDLESGTANRRSVWTISTQPYPDAHFATFPEELPTTCIKAGTSAKGCCPDCGAPWKRIVEKDHQPTRPGRNGNKAKGATDELMRPLDEHRHVTSTVTKGWQPGCDCGNPSTVPCVVLDPFAGSGTTIRVANLLGHYGIGCEANPEYAQMAVRRITKREGVKQPEPIVGQKALF